MAKKIGYHNLVVNVATGVGTYSTITVYNANTVVASTIYSDPDGTAKSNPFDTDANGRFNFYADQGKYDIQVSGTGITTYKLEDVPIVASYAIPSKPLSGEYKVKDIKINAAGKIVIIADGTPES